MAAEVVKQTAKTTLRKFTVEEKIGIVLEGLRGRIPVSELCRKHGIQSSVYHKWSKAFLDAGRDGLAKETHRDAKTKEVLRLKEENESLKTAVAEIILENKQLKKSIGL